MTPNSDQTGAPAPTTAETKAATKPSVGARRAQVAISKPKPGKKPAPAKKTSSGRAKAKVAKPGARSGSKTAKILDLLEAARRSRARELLKATGWHPHSLRGFLSGTVGKKMSLTLGSTKEDDGSGSTH
jgi:hypothetical protein